MGYVFNYLLRKRTLYEYGLFLFLVGIFFLPSSLFLAIIFLLPAFIIGGSSHKNSFIKDKWNLPFLIFGLLILLSSILQNFVITNNYEAIWDPNLSFIGMGNWLPFIYFFWACQPFIDSKEKRRLFGIILIVGSFPVLISGFGQYFLNWTGPFKTLNGLIIWYQRPIKTPGGLSGLFSNQNYAGAWLNLVWPFCLALFLRLMKSNALKRVGCIIL